MLLLSNMVWNFRDGKMRKQEIIKKKGQESLIKIHLDWSTIYVRDEGVANKLYSRTESGANEQASHHGCQIIRLLHTSTPYGVHCLCLRPFRVRRASAQQNVGVWMQGWASTANPDHGRHGTEKFISKRNMPRKAQIETGNGTKHVMLQSRLDISGRSRFVSLWHSHP